MNCPECNGKTAVVDRRGVKRRRKCLACGERFSTFEVLADAHGTMAGPKPAAAPVVQKPAEAKPAAPKKKFDLKKQASARRRIEELRDMAFLDPDYDFIPEKW